MPTTDHKYTENEGDYYGLCVLCLKKANNYIITYPEELEYLSEINNWLNNDAPEVSLDAEERHT